MAEYETAFDVVIAGAGPVGLCLAIELGRRGVRTLLLERNTSTAPWPKMDRCNGRTMELFRRIGIADRVRALGYPADNPMDVFLLRSLAEPAIETLQYASVAKVRARIARCTDGSLPAEPYQLVSQNAVEPFLKEVAEATPGVSVRYGQELTDFQQDAQGVTVNTLAEGMAATLRAAYLVGCDGGRSLVRKALGISLAGQGNLRSLTQTIFHSEELYERIVAGKGRHYCLPGGASFTAQGSRKEFTFHSANPPDSDFKAIIARAIGFPCAFEISHVVPWKHHLLLADRYRSGRVLIAGDAAHLVIPTGGLGMNTGVGDAFDLAWKLAGMVHGWGGEALLDAYEAERRPVAARNIEASGWAAGSVPKWGMHFTPLVHEDTVPGRRARRRLCEAFRTYHSRMYGPDGYGMVGVEYGYSYAWSPIVADEAGNVPQWDIEVYTPHARPGARLPNMWLSDGVAIQDIMGMGYTLLDLGLDLGLGLDCSVFEDAFARLGAPLQVTRLDDPALPQVYGARLLLLRPDLHVAWRGDGLPADARGLAALVTGWAAGKE